MADKKNIPINAENGAQGTPAVSLAEKLNQAAERMTRVTSGNQDKKAEQARLLKEAEADAARRREEAVLARREAEKQAKTVADRKLAEYTYAENYRKKLLKDKEKNISASKAKDMQRKADAEARRRAEIEQEINGLLEAERREADERRARQDAALERARAAKEALASGAKDSAPAIDENTTPAEDVNPIPEDSYAHSEDMPTAEAAMPDSTSTDGAAGGMTLSIPSVSLNPVKESEPKSEEQTPLTEEPLTEGEPQFPAGANVMEYGDYVRAYNESMAAYEQQMREAQESMQRAYAAQMEAAAPTAQTPKTAAPRATVAPKPVTKGKEAPAAEKKTAGAVPVIVPIPTKKPATAATEQTMPAAAPAAPTAEPAPTAQATPAAQTAPNAQAAAATEEAPKATSPEAARTEQRTAPATAERRAAENTAAKESAEPSFAKGSTEAVENTKVIDNTETEKAEHVKTVEKTESKEKAETAEASEPIAENTKPEEKSKVKESRKERKKREKREAEERIRAAKAAKAKRATKTRDEKAEEPETTEVTEKTETAETVESVEKEARTAEKTEATEKTAERAEPAEKAEESAKKESESTEKVESIEKAESTEKSEPNEKKTETVEKAEKASKRDKRSARKVEESAKKTEESSETEEGSVENDNNDDNVNKYLSEIGTLSALVASHDEKIRRMEEDNERREREAREERERLAHEAEEAEKDEASDLVDAEQIIVRENKQPVYDEEAIKRDIESMNRRSLPGYLSKSDKKLRVLEKQAKRIERRIDRSTEDDRIEATLIAISVRKDIVDLLCENLKCCALFKVKKHNDYFRKKIRRATAKYNALVAIYESYFNEELTKADPTVVDGILEGDDYMPLPSVTYVKETVKVPVEDTELGADGETVKVARRITASETKLRKKLGYHVEKKNSTTVPSQRASHLVECLMIERDIVELFSQGLASSVAIDNKKQIKVRKKKLDLAVAEYNSFAEEFEATADGEVTKASLTLSDEIIAGEEYTPLPEIKYTLERIEPEKSAKEAKKERRARLNAARRGEIMPDDVRFLGTYITRSDKAALKIERLIKKNDKARARLSGEAYNRAILNSAMLHAKIVTLDRDALIAAYRLDAESYIPECKEKLLSAVQNYNDDITAYDDATGIKLVKITPTLGEDIVSGRSYQVIPELLWRERFVELADLSSLTAGDGEVFVFPTLDKVAEEQSTDEGRFVIEAKLGSLPLSSDRPIALPVNTARIFDKVKVDRARRISTFDSALKKAEHMIERELSVTAKRIAAADATATVNLLVKRIVLLREMVNRRIEGLTYAVSFSRKRRAESYKLKIIQAMVRYNAAVDEYNAVADEKFSYADAHIPYAILQDRDYSPLPEIVYRREFIEKNGDDVRVVSTLAKSVDEDKAEAAIGGVIAPVPEAKADKVNEALKEESLEEWNIAAKEQFNDELAESAAIEAKNHSEMADYMKRLAESYSVSAKNNNESARYYRDLAGESADDSDQSVKMATYYARLAEEQRNKAEYIASQASQYERDAMESAKRVREYAEKTREAVDIASIAMLDAKDNLERKIGVGVVTSTPASYRASVVQILDDQGLRKYAEKNDREERIKESRMRGLVKRASEATGNDKITLTLDALTECKGRIDIIVDILRQAVRSDSQRFKKLYGERLLAAITDYNTIADAYTAVTLKPISHVDPAIVTLVLEGKRFAPIPDITYTRGFKAPGDENVVVLKPGITVEEAVSTTTFASRAELAETISKQLAVDIDSVSKGIEYEIKMLERSENVNQAYRFGFGSKNTLKNAKKKITLLKKDGVRAIEEQRRDDERYYSVVYANPMTVAVSRSAVKGAGKNATRLEAEHSKKSVMAVREDIARIRENVIALLDERHKLNCEIVALYTGSDVDPHGLPVSDKYQEMRMHAARRTYRKLRSQAELVKRLNNIGEVTKSHIFSLMNKKIVADSNLALFKYRYNTEKHSKAGRKLLIKDIRATTKQLKAIDRDIKGFVARAVRVNKERRNEVYRGAAMFALFCILVGAGVLAYIFRDPLINYLKNFIGGAFGGIL